jgi:hypothetical protein
MTGAARRITEPSFVLAYIMKATVIDAGHGGEAAWPTAVAELERRRGEIEAEVIADDGFLNAAHDWAVFLAAVESKSP